MNKQQDIFDRIMDLRCFGFIRPVYIKYKEILLYLFFGGLAFIVSIGSFVFFERVLGLSALVANLFSWILAVAFAYITNRIWVFSNVAHGAAGIRKEIFSFFTGRVVTLLLEELILYVGITLFEVDSIAVKIIGQIAVIISNYFVSKLLVFKCKN